MKILKTIQKVKEYIKPLKKDNKTIGFVPTMGALHKGHLELGKAAKKQSDIIIYSIFVNPTQFAPGEDFEKYPRVIEDDIKKLESIKVDAVFLPKKEEIYPKNTYTNVIVSVLDKILCGKSRPTHFQGVTTIVSKLFNITECNKAFFGKKDYQQLTILKQMVRDLNKNVEIIGVDIVRESDGLALSSRNKYLNKEERKSAIILSKSIKYAEENLNNFSTTIELIHSLTKYIVTNEPKVNIEYIELRDSENLDKINELDKNKKNIILLLAVKIGNTRLIDNKIIR